MNFTPLNIEQSLARYLADRFKEKGYNIKWFDSQQVEDVGGAKTVTLVKDFPAEATNLASHDGQKGANIINVPAFSVFATPAVTEMRARQGIGESLFQWQATIRIDGFADTELEWYHFSGYFSEWFGNPDTTVTLYDYDADLTSNTPTALDQRIQFVETDIGRVELDERPAVRFYINMSITAIFVE